VLEAIYKLVGNWGWAIILLTIGIKAAVLPAVGGQLQVDGQDEDRARPAPAALKERTATTSQKLQAGDDGALQAREDQPARRLPADPAVQIPVFIALYWVLLGAVEMRDAPWLGWIRICRSRIRTTSCR
jgi:YidC/Oxa1 family membrane protein insertase